MTISLGGKDWLRILLQVDTVVGKFIILWGKLMELPYSCSAEIKGPMRRQTRKHKAAVAGTGTKVSGLLMLQDMTETKPGYRAGVSKHIMLPELFLMASPREAAAS